MGHPSHFLHFSLCKQLKYISSAVFSFSFTHLAMWFCSAGLTTVKTTCSLTYCSTWKMPVSVGAVATALSRVHATSASVNCPHCPTRWGRGTRQEGQVCPWSRFSVLKPVWPSLERTLSLTGDRTAFSCITWHLFSFFEKSCFRWSYLLPFFFFSFFICHCVSFHYLPCLLWFVFAYVWENLCVCARLYCMCAFTFNHLWHPVILWSQYGRVESNTCGCWKRKVHSLDITEVLIMNCCKRRMTHHCPFYC